jgi:hypothetical protein
VTLSRAQSPELKRASNTVMCLTPRESGPLSRHLLNLTVYEQEFGCAEYLHHPALLGLSIIWTHGLTRQGPHTLASSGLLRGLTRLRFDIEVPTIMSYESQQPRANCEVTACCNLQAIISIAPHACIHGSKPEPSPKLATIKPRRGPWVGQQTRPCRDHHVHDPPWNTPIISISILTRK